MKDVKIVISNPTFRRRDQGGAFYCFEFGAASECFSVAENVRGASA